MSATDVSGVFKFERGCMDKKDCKKMDSDSSDSNSDSDQFEAGACCWNSYCNKMELELTDDPKEPKECDDDKSESSSESEESDGSDSSASESEETDDSDSSASEETQSSDSEDSGKLIHIFSTVVDYRKVKISWFVLGYYI